MVLVMVVGIGSAGWIQVTRREESRDYYELLAEEYADLESQLRRYANRTRDEWLSDCRAVDERNKQRAMGLRKGTRQEVHPPEPGEARRRVAHVARLRKRYERAAHDFWLPIKPDPPGPD
jgi:DNA-binding transcriptional regulator PaaX